MKTESLKMITRMKFSYSFKDEKSSVCKTDLQDKCDTITHWGSSIPPSGIQNILLTTQSAPKFEVAKIRFQENFNNPFKKKCKLKLSCWNTVVKGKGLSSVISVSKETRWPLNARELMALLLNVIFARSSAWGFLFSVARTNLYACRLCFLIAFFSRNDLTIFYDFWYPSSFG